MRKSQFGRGHRRAIGRCALVTVLVAVLNPLPDIAVHIVETEGILREGSHIERFLAKDPHLAVAIGEVGGHHSSLACS